MNKIQLAVFIIAVIVIGFFINKLILTYASYLEPVGQNIGNIEPEMKIDTGPDIITKSGNLSIFSVSSSVTTTLTSSSILFINSGSVGQINIQNINGNNMLAANNIPLGFMWKGGYQGPVFSNYNVSVGTSSSYTQLTLGNLSLSTSSIMNFQVNYSIDQTAPKLILLFTMSN